MMLSVAMAKADHSKLPNANKGCARAALQPEQQIQMSMSVALASEMSNKFR
jgi:hypothetical protein